MGRRRQPSKPLVPDIPWMSVPFGDPLRELSVAETDSCRLRNQRGMFKRWGRLLDNSASSREDLRSAPYRRGGRMRDEERGERRKQQTQASSDKGHDLMQQPKLAITFHPDWSSSRGQEPSSTEMSALDDERRNSEPVHASLCRVGRGELVRALQADLLTRMTLCSIISSLSNYAVRSPRKLAGGT